MPAAEGDYTCGGVGRYVVSWLICCGYIGDCDPAVQANFIGSRFWRTPCVRFLERPHFWQRRPEVGHPCHPCNRCLLLHYFAAMSTDAFVVSHSMFIVQPLPDFA